MPKPNVTACTPPIPRAQQPVSRFPFARHREIEHGRVALPGCHLDAKPCIIIKFSLRPGKHAIHAVAASAQARNPPPPGFITHVSLLGAEPGNFQILDVYDSYAAVANSLMRASSRGAAMLERLGEVIELGADVWIGPVGCIPNSVVPRHAVVRALVHGADSITCPPRRADGEGPHLVDAVFGTDSRPQMEALFAKRYYRNRKVNWYASEPYSAVISSVVHAFEVEPVRFEMAIPQPVATAGPDDDVGVAAAGQPQLPSSSAPDRGYGAHRFTYQHRPHQAAVRRRGGDPDGTAAPLQLRSDDEGLRAAAAVVRHQQGFTDLGLRLAPAAGGVVVGPTGGRCEVPVDKEVRRNPAAAGSIEATTAAGCPRRVSVERGEPGTLTPRSFGNLPPPPPPASTTAPRVGAIGLSHSKRPQPLCAKVLLHATEGCRQLQCYVEQRRVRAPQPGDILVIVSPFPVAAATTTPEAVATYDGGDSVREQSDREVPEGAFDCPPAGDTTSAPASGIPTTTLGRVIAVSRWSRRKAGPGQRSPSALRRATIDDVMDAAVTAYGDEAPAVSTLRQTFGGALVRLFRTRLHADGPSVLTLAEVHHDVLAAAGHTAASVRAAVAGATGAHARHVLFVTPTVQVP